MRKIVGILALSFTIVACTTATLYQPYRAETAGGVHGGYSGQQFAPDRYLVRFHGNELTSRDRVEGYMLYWAAELTVQHGYDWFQMVDHQTEHDTETYVRPDPSYRPYYGGAVRRLTAILALFSARPWLGYVGSVARRSVLG